MKAVVTTVHRGVFFGTIKSQDNETVVLENARSCLQWPKEVKGVFGLATVGPLVGSKVTDAVSEMTLHNVSCVMQCSDAASAQWESGPWQE